MCCKSDLKLLKYSQIVVGPNSPFKGISPKTYRLIQIWCTGAPAYFVLGSGAAGIAGGYIIPPDSGMIEFYNVYAGPDSCDIVGAAGVQGAFAVYE